LALEFLETSEELHKEEHGLVLWKLLRDAGAFKNYYAGRDPLLPISSWRRAYDWIRDL
jgi:hypothetical protein